MSFEENVYNFIKELGQFNYKIQSIDRIWNIIFTNQKNKWHHVQVTKYREAYYIVLMDGDICTLEVTLNKSIEAGQSFGLSSYNDGRDDLSSAWGDVIIAAHKWLKATKKDWIKTNRQVQENYPLNHRIGVVPNALIRASLTDIYRIDKALGKAKTKKFIQIVESQYFHDHEKTTRKSMCAKDFFDYCKIAYLAGQDKEENIDEHLSGREMYQRYADGRHGGLLEIKMNSKKEFAEWIDGTHSKITLGGHPWEIKRGGNTTHIDLYVRRPSYYTKEGFEVVLRGTAIGRLRETICMFLGLYDAGFPISIADPGGIRKRLLAQDNIGIVPYFSSLHRANQGFYEHQDVYDVLYFDDLGRYKRRIKPFITWEPLPLLIPKH